jgi:hypothetical protein
MWLNNTRKKKMQSRDVISGDRGRGAFAPRPDFEEKVNYNYL